MVAAQFLRNLIRAVPYILHTVLTDSGVRFTRRSSDRYACPHIFGRVCETHGIEHRLTRVKHPGTDGQVERMNWTLGEATVERFRDNDRVRLRQHLWPLHRRLPRRRRLKSSKDLTPCEFICKQWISEPVRFGIDPIHLMRGLNI